MSTVQAMLTFGRCEGFACAPGDFAAAPADKPPRWAQAVLEGPPRLCTHARVGEVAHELARVAAAAEAVHAPFLEKLF